MIAAVLALSVPGVASAQTLTVVGLDGAARTLSAAQVADLGRHKAELDEGGKAIVYEGPLLSHVLRAAGVPMGQRLHGDPTKAYVVVTGSDGFQAVYSLPELDRDFHDDTVILADRMSGGPMPEKQAPWRVVSAGDKKSWRAVYAVTRIEVKLASPPGASAPASHH